MRSFSLLSSVAPAFAAVSNPGGFISLSESALKRGAENLINKIITDLEQAELPGSNSSFGWFEPLRMQDVAIGSYDVSVLASQGVQLTLQDMSNEIAHTQFCVHDPLRLVHCCGELWAAATGQSYQAMNTVVVDDDGRGMLHTVTPAGGFDAGNIVIHHNMDGAACEAVADVIHVVDGVVIDLITDQLQSLLPGIVAQVVDTAADLVLNAAEKPVPLGLGKEKFQLDNSFVSVDYDNRRISHYSRAEFKSTRHPVESPLLPPPLSPVDGRDAVVGFSDYVMNTLFDSFFAEHMFEERIKLPLITTPLSDKICPLCPVVATITFTEPARTALAEGQATNSLKNMNFTLGVEDFSGTVLPLVTLSVNATASAQFDLHQTKKNANVKVRLFLDGFEQRLLVSFIGDVDLSDVSRLLHDVLTTLLDIVNLANPGLPVPVIAGVKLGNPSFAIANRQLLLLADLEQADAVSDLVI